MEFNRKYYAKLMLAGEYGVIVGSEALTIPLKNFYARIAQKDSETDPAKVIKSVSSLRELFYYIQSLPKNSFYALPQGKEMDDMLKKGYYVESNIPHGYGIGSSGAISALVYDQFFRGSKELDLQKQRKDLANIESFYHGKSSGVDGMSCYLGQPLHFLPDGEIRQTDFDYLNVPGGYRFFLIDSGQVYDTGPLVKLFLEKMRKEQFKQQITGDYIPLIKKLIAALTGTITADPALLLRAVSDFHWNNFREMIPENMEDAWINGQVSNTYYLKINGSGGGYLLGIAHEESKEAVEGMLEGFELIWV